MPFVKRQRMTALSYQRACLHAIDHLTKFGYSDIQAYMIPGSVPIEGRLSGVRPRPLGRRRSLAAWMCRRPVSNAPSGVGACDRQVGVQEVVAFGHTAGNHQVWPVM